MDFRRGTVQKVSNVKIKYLRLFLYKVNIIKTDVI